MTAPVPATVLRRRSVDRHGDLLHEGDPAAQLLLALANLLDALADADLDLAQVVNIRVLAPAPELVARAVDLVADHLAHLGAQPPVAVVALDEPLLPGELLVLEATTAAAPAPIGVATTALRSHRP